MDFDHPSVLFSGLLIGDIGMGLFLHGKRNADLRTLFAGIALSVVPLVGHTLLVLWGTTGLCASALYISNRRG